MKTKSKNYSSRLLAITVFLLSVALVQAQPPGGGQGGQRGGPPPIPNDQQIEQMVTDLSKELSLTEKQENQVSEAYYAHFEQLEGLVGDGSSRPDREVMEKLKDDFETEVKSYLTKDQQKQFDKYQKKQQSNRGGQGDPPR